jgi:iron(III) transport system permease protein
MMDGRFVSEAANTIGVAVVAALLAVGVAVLLAYAVRISPGRLSKAGARIAALGYAIPGPVIAVGVLIPFAWADNTFDGWMRDAFGVSTGLVLSGTLAALLFAYVVRFLAISLNTVESGLAKITPNMDRAARSLGAHPSAALRRVHMPLLRGSLLTAGLLVFVHVMKELPATLILRPFDFNTLAVRAYELASDERLADAAPAALAIVVVGLVPVLLLSSAIARSRPGEGR